MQVDWTINVPQIVAWLLLGGGAIWKLSSLVTKFEDLLNRFNAHEQQDEKRFQELGTAVREVQLEQARAHGGRR